MVSLRIEELDAGRDEEYGAFLDALGRTSPSVLGYHYPLYRDMLAVQGVGEPLYLGAWSGDELVGALPGFVRRSELGVVYCSLPFFGPNAGVSCVDGPIAVVVHAELLGALVAYMRAQEKPLTASVYTPFLFDRYEHYDCGLAGATVVPRFTSYLPLWNAVWKKEISYDIRRAERLGVKVCSEITPARTEAFYRIYEQNCLDYGIPTKPRGIIEKLIAAAVERTRVSCLFALLDDAVIAGLMVLWGPMTASYYLPCTLASERSLQPGSLLIDRAVQEAKQRGAQFWNWEASPSRESGVYKYKMKWGSVEGNYRIYAFPFCDQERLHRIGARTLSESFPYFFVYPYDRL